MTERKPLSMSTDAWVDRQIEAAEAEGAFDDLPGKGKPIPGLQKPYDENWWVKALLEREGLAVVPAALGLRRDVERELEGIGRLGSEERVRQAVAQLNVRICKRNREVLEGPASTTGTLDVDAVVRRWRERRSGANRKG
jgi:hypothetical protein